MRLSRLNWIIFSLLWNRYAGISVHFPPAMAKHHSAVLPGDAAALLRSGGGPFHRVMKAAQRIISRPACRSYHRFHR
jgi:hypothetical protein